MFLFKYQHILHLDLSDNAIAETAKDTFYNLLKLTGLDLSPNHLKTLHRIDL